MKNKISKLWIIPICLLIILAFVISLKLIPVNVQIEKSFIIVNNSLTFIDSCGVKDLTPNKIDAFCRSKGFDEGMRGYNVETELVTCYNNKPQDPPNIYTSFDSKYTDFSAQSFCEWNVGWI